MIPIPVGFARYAIVAGIVAATLGFTYVTGRKHEREYQNDKIRAASVAAAKETQRLVEKNYRISVEVTKVLERERVITQTLLERVYVEIPPDACPIHPSFRVLHDAAARGDDSTAASGTNGAPVPVKDAAATVVANYGDCRKDKERLIRLQQWAAENSGKEILCRTQ